ncbi:MAG TPA: hypothetical protein DCR14_20450 [Acidimicrobiaceae bacterium]|nr:hypothetical protein [Acidimicrobiaceae bacterium]
MTVGRPLPRRNPALEIAEFEVEFVVYDPGTQQVHHLRELTAVVFDACGEAVTTEELAAELAEAMQVPVADAERSVVDTVDVLARAGLLAVDPPAAMSTAVEAVRERLDDDE